MSTTPLNDVDTGLDKILFPIYNYGWPGTGYNGLQEQLPAEEAKARLKALISTIAEQIIGEDEVMLEKLEVWYGSYKKTLPDHRLRTENEARTIRNEQRAKERQRLKDYMENKQ